MAYDVNKNLNSSIWGGNDSVVPHDSGSTSTQAPVGNNVQAGVTDQAVIAQAQVGDKESQVVQNIDQNVANQAGQDWAAMMQQQQAQNSALYAQQAAEQAARMAK